MPGRKNNNIICRLKQIRTDKGLTQTRLADLVDIKRQAVYDIEAGKYLPNTAVAIALAKVLGCRVEDIFETKATGREKQVNLVQNDAAPGARISIAKVRGRLYGYPASGQHGFTRQMNTADGLVESGCGQVHFFRSDEELNHTALLLGCDPAFSLLEHHLVRQKSIARLRCRFASSKKALEMLSQGKAHLAGTHFHDTGNRQSNIAFAKKNFSNTGSKLIAFSSFEEGLMVKPGNPLQIRTIEDLARADVRLANREKGAALRTLIDDRLKKAGIPAKSVQGYDNIVFSHAEGADLIRYGRADAALGLKLISEAFGLGFIPLEEVRCDLVIPADLMDHPAVKVVLDILQSRSLQKELEHLPGYDARYTGNLIAEL